MLLDTLYLNNHHFAAIVPIISRSLSALAQKEKFKTLEKFKMQKNLAHMKKFHLLKMLNDIEYSRSLAMKVINNMNNNICH